MPDQQLSDHVEESQAEQALGRRLIRLVLLPLALLSIAAVAFLWPGEIGDPATSDVVTGVQEESLVDATVQSVEPVACAGMHRLDKSCERIIAVLDEGDTAGATVEFDRSTAGRDRNVVISQGDRVILLASPEAVDELRYTYYDHVRTAPILLLLIVFVAAVLVFARWQGLGALIGLGFTLVVIAVFVVPSILSGHNAILVALASAVLMMIVTLFLAHGPGLVTVTALLGTFAALAISALLAAIWLAVSHVFGLGSQEAILVSIGAADINLGSLILAGVIIGSLGILDDVTVTQASVVTQLGRANPTMNLARLARQALQVGRDHVASTVNTLILAYAGAGLPLFILFSLGDRSFVSIVNGEAVTTELIRVLVGSLGIIAAVPLTTVMAAWAVTRSRRSTGHETVPVGAEQAEATLPPPR